MSSDSLAAVSLGAFRATRVGLQLPKSKVTYDRWEEEGYKLREVQAALRWCIGDWMNYGEAAFGEMASQASDIWPEYSYSNLANMASVANSFEISRRHEDVTWSMHAEIAKLKPEKQDEWLEILSAGVITRAELRLSLDGGSPKRKHECPLCGRSHVYE